MERQVHRDRNTPVVGGRIVAEYDALTKKVTHLYTLREMVLRSNSRSSMVYIVDHMKQQLGYMSLPTVLCN